MRILGIDPSLRSTGWGVIDLGKREPVSLGHGVIRNPSIRLQADCLLEIRKGILRVIDEFEPTEAAFESVIYVQNSATAISLGAARGASILAAAERDIPSYEYPAKIVKKAVSGLGAARKDQVAFMVRAMLHMTETPSTDAADALAIALTHAHGAHLRTSVMKRRALGQKQGKSL
jgi:crossover junction endodeoxyribonuclease RuvC